MKNVAVLLEDGAFALFFRPHPGEFDSSKVPTPRNLPSKAKKMLMPCVCVCVCVCVGVGGVGFWAQLELADASIYKFKSWKFTLPFGITKQNY